MDVFYDPALNGPVGPAPVFLDELPHQGPFPMPWPIVPPASEVLRQLAVLYLHEPNSQAAVIRMERAQPGHAYGVRVYISLELAGI